MRPFKFIFWIVILLFGIGIFNSSAKPLGVLVMIASFVMALISILRDSPD